MVEDDVRRDFVDIYNFSLSLSLSFSRMYLNVFEIRYMILILNFDSSASSVGFMYTKINGYKTTIYMESERGVLSIQHRVHCCRYIYSVDILI